MRNLAAPWSAGLVLALALASQAVATDNDEPYRVHLRTSTASQPPGHDIAILAGGGAGAGRCADVVDRVRGRQRGQRAAFEIGDSDLAGHYQAIIERQTRSGNPDRAGLGVD